MSAKPKRRQKLHLAGIGGSLTACGKKILRDTVLLREEATCPECLEASKPRPPAIHYETGGPDMVIECFGDPRPPSTELT